MTEQDILKKTIEIGIKKGYRIDHPEDWYDGITKKDLNFFSVSENNINKYFKNTNQIIRKIFPNYHFLEWLFKKVESGWWIKKENVVEFLKWFEKQVGIHNIEDWYNITKTILGKYHGGSVIYKYSVYDIPSILYPDFKFEKTKFKGCPLNDWSNFESIKKILIDFYTINKRLPTYFEAKKSGFSTGITRHGGIYKIAKELGLLTSNQYKTLSGDIVQSSYEVTFANFLYLNNISFNYEGKIIGNKGYEYDFKIGDVYVEIWGYIGNEYDKKRCLKESVYKDNNLKLISIESDIFEKHNSIINEHFIDLMKKFDIKKDCFCNDLSQLNFFVSFNKDRIIEELKSECEKQCFRVFPTKKWWRENGFKKHIKFLERNKVSINDIANMFNLDSNKTKNGYWTWEVLKEEILFIINNNNGKFPTTVYLRLINRDDLISVIYGFFGGIISVRNRMRYISEKIKTDHQIYWENIDNIKKELSSIIDDIGSFPTKTYLEKTRRGDILSSINKYHGGLTNVKKNMGYATNKSGSYYKDFKNVKNELMIIYNELGKMPTQEYLRSIIRGDLVSGMQKFHGGFKLVKEKLGFDRICIRNNKYKDFKLVESELIIIYNNLGVFPTVSYLKTIKKSTLVNSIYKYHGGHKSVKQKLNLK